MSLEAQALLDEAMKRLSISERAELASELIASLDGPSDPGIEDLWAAEIDRRMAEVDSGRVQTVPWEQAESRIRERLRTIRNP